MISPANHDQHRAARRQAGEPAMRRGGAPSSTGHKFQLPGPPSRHGRMTSSQRPNSPAVHDAGRGFLFMPRTIVLDEITELRLCRLNRRQPVLRGTLNTGHHVLADLSDGPETHSSTPSTVAVFNDRDRDTEGFAHVRTAFREGRNVFCG